MNHKNGLGRKTYELDEDEKKIIELIRQGEFVSSGGDRKVSYTLLRLRRNGVIENHGSRTKPEWRISEKYREMPKVIVDLDKGFWMWV